MRIRHACALLLVCLSWPAWAGDLALKRVMLSSGGVAYLEHEATVTGDAELTLDVPLNQVDDVLKSIVVYDDKGGVGSATLLGRQPVAQAFGDLPFGQDALQSSTALLNALQGAEISVNGNVNLTGKILHVTTETEHLGELSTVTRNRVAVLTDQGLQQFVLEDAESIRFTDPAVAAQVAKGLAVIAAHRTKDRRQIVLTTRGQGERTVRVGYVVGAPLWKASYRLTLPADPVGEKAKLQGWAVLENMTGLDWNGVELTLLSGNPVSFRQAIYEAYYVNRPEVPVEVAGRVLPKVDSGVTAPAKPAGMLGGIAQDFAEAGKLGGGHGGGGHAGGRGRALSMAPTAAAPSPPPEPADEVDTAEAEETTTQVAFRVPVAVTLAAGRSAMVPIAERSAPAERVSLYQNGEHPLASVKLVNDGKSGLPPGVITVYEDGPQGSTYVGDARLGVLPIGETRLLSYAVDDKTKVVRAEDETAALAKASIAEGVLTLTRTERQGVHFHLVAPVTEARRIIIEQPKLEGWQVVEPDEKTLDQTAGAYRLTVALKPGEAADRSIVFETPVEDTVRVANLDDPRIVEVTSSKVIPAAIKEALGEVARLERIANEKKATVDRIAHQLEQITADQGRIRSNLERVDHTAALHKRYLDKLAEEETQIETLQGQSGKATDEWHAAGAAVDAYIATLKL